MGHQWPTTPRATHHPTVTELAWAAGFLEGEGSFKGAWTKGNQTRAGYRKTEGVEASQVQREPLERLQKFFGGSIGEYKHAAKVRCKSSVFYKWHISGCRARGVMMTLFMFMSPARQGAIILSLRKREG